MPYSRPEVTSGVTRITKPFVENILDGIDEKLDEATANATYVRPPDVRVSAARLTAPNSIYNAALDMTQRTVFQMPFASGRWRMWFRNRSLRSATVLTTPVTVTGLWTGTPTRDATNSSGHRWMGAATAAPTQRSGQLTVPIDGSRVFTEWITGDPFVSGEDKLLSWGITAPNSGTGVASGNGYQGMQASGAAKAADASPAGAAMGKSALYLDVGIEYELDSTAQIVVVLGDSNGLSYSAGRYAAPDAVLNTPPSVLPHESWPMQAGAMAGASVINLSVGSASPGDLAVTFPQIWDAIPAGTVVDAVIVPIGINGVAGGTSGFSPHMRTINSKIRTDLSCDRIFWATMPPAGYTTMFGRLTSAASAGATSISMDTSPAVGVIMIGSGYTTEDVSVTSVSGSGPYTATISTPLAFAHSAQEPVSWNSERYRKLINMILRQLPDGISGTVDFEKLLESAPDSPVGDARYTDSDLLHWNRGASGIRAQAVAPLIALPKTKPIIRP